ncbi:HEAT repeat domain-containing protein [Xanthomonas hyacinthi]|uniref:HEAT repeat domain-containing protein n=1 Tax=Xanthomonas hyacinthi TaxID=56455 RepID=UPI001302E9F0|nr:HEAT repeat domain-containing protein [Xanthomonas hyacinthi]QGY76407.1 HEAT repeat domain-containing protein [Xanthomonas hyacinthi]
MQLFYAAFLYSYPSINFSIMPTKSEAELIVKNSDQTQIMANDLETQKIFFTLNGAGNRFDDRFVETGLPEKIDMISSALSEEISANEVELSLRKISALFTPDLIKEFIQEESSRFNQSSIHTIATQFLESEAFYGVVFYSNPHVNISVLALPPVVISLKQAKNLAKNKKSVTVQGNDTLMKFISPGDATIELWHAEPFGSATALGNQTAVPLPYINPVRGESVFLEGGRHGLSIKHCISSVLMVLITRRRPRTSVSAHYRTDDGSLFSCSSASVMSSRAQLLVTTVRELGFSKGISTLIELLDHPDHFVRWHVMREALALDMAVAKPHLVRLASNDVHPQVREVAKKSLEILSKAQQCH